jgi:predicted MFS family arabinose efflux permease
VCASALVGVTTVVAPIIGPMAAGLVPDNRQGSVSGSLLSGSIGGILLARVVAGALGERLGWRAPYLVAAMLTLLIAVVLARTMPETVPPSRQRYPAMLVEPLRLMLREPALRRSCRYQASVFAGFCAVWTSLPLLLTGPTYGLTVHVVGALGLISAATMVCTPLAGRLADRNGPDRVNLICLIGTIASAAVLAVGALGGLTGFVALTVGVLLLDVTMQSGMVANLARIYAVSADSRSRLNTAYMTCAFLGGSAGSWLGAWVCTHLGWTAVGALVALTAAIALTHHLNAPTAGTAVVGASIRRR